MLLVSNRVRDIQMDRLPILTVTEVSSSRGLGPPNQVQPLPKIEFDLSLLLMVKISWLVVRRLLSEVQRRIWQLEISGTIPRREE